MTVQKNVSIQVGDVTLSTANIPDDGINLNKLNEDTRKALSIFDKNNDGKLSSAEINDAIVKLEAADKQHTEELNAEQTITTKKNGKLDDIEFQTVELEYFSNIKVEELSSLDIKTLEKLETQLNNFSCRDLDTLSREDEVPYLQAVNMIRDFIYKRLLLNKEKNSGGSQELINRLEEDIKYDFQEMKATGINFQFILDKLTNNLQNKRIASVNEIKNGAKALQREITAENEIKKGLQRTYNDNWLKDAEGNHYKYNEQTITFEKVDNVVYVAKDGSYHTKN